MSGEGSTPEGHTRARDSNGHKGFIGNVHPQSLTRSRDTVAKGAPRAETVIRHLSAAPCPQIVAGTGAAPGPETITSSRAAPGRERHTGTGASP